MNNHSIGLVLTALLFTSGCIIPNNPYSDPAYSIMYSKFLMDANRYRRDLDLWNLVITSGQISDPGSCVEDKTVLVNESYWGSVGIWDKELLIYHELGHCLLGQEHRPASIMAYPMMPGTQYQANREAYLSELFNFPVGRQESYYSP